MLLKVKIKNFLSFYEETVFDMFPNPKRTSFTNHVYNEMKVPLLKQAAIYGANGSGKSNFLDSIMVLQNIVLKKDFLKTYSMNINKFRLSGEKNNEPISFSIEFLIEGKYFIYKIDIGIDKIVNEELFISGIGEKNDELIFRREGSRILSKLMQNEIIKKATAQLIKNNPFSSLLSLNMDFPVFEDNRVKLAQKWFEKNLRILSLRRVNPALISLLSANEDLLKFTNDVIEKIGLGIEGIGVEKKKISEILNDDNENTKRYRDVILKRMEKGNVAQMHNDKVVICFEEENGEQIAKRLFFTHLGLNGYKADMEIECQSDGTARIINLIPAFYDIKNKDCVYLIDEIENSIHPTLMINLIKYLSNIETKGQLIFTTHETELLNQQELMRPDEVWFAEKSEGCTKLYSLNDFKLHNTINIKNGYLEGRYGAIPFIGEIKE